MEQIMQNLIGKYNFIAISSTISLPIIVLFIMPNFRFLLTMQIMHLLRDYILEQTIPLFHATMLSLAFRNIAQTLLLRQLG